MKTFKFHIKTQVVTKTGELSAVYFRFREGKVAKTTELINGKAFADYSPSGKLLGIEIISPCKLKVIEKIIPAKERAPISNFVRKSSPREMVLT